jgi:hypothetical protein
LDWIKKVQFEIRQRRWILALRSVAKMPLNAGAKEIIDGCSLKAQRSGT